MADSIEAKEVGNPTPAEYNGVSVDHPAIIEHIRGGIKNGWDKHKIQRVVGMPMEVIERHMKRIAAEGKG